MLGAIAGDIIGSVHEYIGTKTTTFELFHPRCGFTDDTVLTIAVADCLLHGLDYVTAFHDYVRSYPGAGYGVRFHRWAAARDTEPYHSWGNGSAMRVSAVAYAFDSLEKVLSEAKRSAEVTHNHPEGVRGAEATAAAIFLARQGESKSAIKKSIEAQFGYDLSPTLNDLRPTSNSTNPAKIPSPPPSSPSWNQRTLKMRSVMRYHWVETRTLWRASPEASPKLIIAEFPRTSRTNA